MSGLPANQTQLGQVVHVHLNIGYEQGAVACKLSLALLKLFVWAHTISVGRVLLASEGSRAREP